METRRIFAKGRKEILAKELELKVDELEHVDFIGADKYDFHLRYQSGSFFSDLQRIERKHGLRFDEFYFSRKAEQRKHSTYINSWHGGSNSFQSKFRQGQRLKYMFYHQGDLQLPKFYSNVGVGRCWLNKAIVRTSVFSARASSWAAIPPIFSLEKKMDFVLKTDFEKIQSRQFVLVNKQKVRIKETYLWTKYPLIHNICETN